MQVTKRNVVLVILLSQIEQLSDLKKLSLNASKELSRQGEIQLIKKITPGSALRHILARC